MTSPVLRALAEARLRDQLASWDAHEREMAQAVARTLGASPVPDGPDDGAAHLADFIVWCETRGVRACPAQPATVAHYVLDRAARGINALSAAVGAVALAHQRLGLSNPAATFVVAAALSRVGAIEAPRAWPKQHRARFVELPADLRDYILKHEARREKVMRQAQNEAAALRRKLAGFEEPLAASEATREAAGADRFAEQQAVASKGNGVQDLPTDLTN